MWRKTDEYISVRLAAVERLTDQRVLVDVAKNDEYSSFRRAAVERLTDQRVLADVAKNDEDWHVRQDAVKRLTDQRMLGNVAKNDKDWWVRRAAMERLTDQHLLAEVAKNGHDREVCREAVERLKIPDLLNAIINGDAIIFCWETSEDVYREEKGVCTGCGASTSGGGCQGCDSQVKLIRDYTITHTHTLDLRDIARERLDELNKTNG